MEIAKALILAGRGADDQPWPTASSNAKHLFPLANRPILFHQLEALRAAGILEAAILAPPAAADAIAGAVGDGRAWDLNVTHLQAGASGELQDALASGREFVADEPVLVQQGDALLRERMHQHIAAFAHERLDTLALRLERRAGIATGKPEPGYLLSPRAVEILLQSHERNPLTGVRARGGRVRIQRVAGYLPCHGGQDTLLDSNRHLLEGITASYDPAALEGSRVQGAVVVHPTAEVRNSLLRGPAIIGPGAHVTDTYIGPYSAIGPNAVLESIEIEHSIVLAGGQLRYLGSRVESSIIGENARVGRGFDVPAAIRLSIGNGAEVILR
jgi:glucose-1-phosphate thymidylyltransferase